MNTQQAKFILQGYRPNGADAGDATFGDALEQARHDQGLRDWFAREQAFDAAVSGKFCEVQPPAGLREAILAGGRLTAPASSGPAWWRQPAWMAMAASLALIGAVALALWPARTAASGALDEFAVTDANHSETHGGHGEETGALQALLNQPTTRLGGALPMDFAALRKAGCRTVNFREHELLEICFQRNGAWFHCYIARRVDFPGLAAAGTPSLVDHSGSSIASWGDASNLYVVVSKTGRANLEKLL